MKYINLLVDSGNSELIELACQESVRKVCKPLIHINLYYLVDEYLEGRDVGYSHPKSKGAKGSALRRAGWEFKTYNPVGNLYNLDSNLYSINVIGHILNAAENSTLKKGLDIDSVLSSLSKLNPNAQSLVDEVFKTSYEMLKE